CCDECIKSTHIHNPFHHIECWTGSFFSRTSLHRLGAQLCLGHSGVRCPNTTPRLTKLLVIVHTNGIHKVTVTYCGCASFTPEPFQLLRAGLYPATWTEPATAFTLQLLKHYQLDSLQSRKPAYDYWAILRRLTDNTRQDPVPDRYEELLRASREWRVLMLLKRSGQALGISRFLPDNSDSVAIHCPACPRVHVNLDENWRAKVSPENRHIYTIFIGIDGNFQAVLKQKKCDQLDKPLLDGRAYFAELDAYKKYMARF
ncbi:hypothetical protein AURDEDRAFT_45850, partial [Auricularia subglabra TFB-10046 SS5]